MLVSPLFRLASFISLFPSNADLPIMVTDSGSARVSIAQFWNALFPICSIPSTRFTSERPAQFANIPAGIFRRLHFSPSASVKSTFFRVGMPAKILLFSLPFCPSLTVVAERLRCSSGVSLKMLLPRLFSAPLHVKFVRFPHPEKPSSRIATTEAGSSTLLNAQPVKAFLIMVCKPWLKVAVSIGLWMNARL